MKINVDHVHKYKISKKETKMRNETSLFAAATEFKLIHLRVDNKPHYLFANSLIPIN